MVSILDLEEYAKKNNIPIMMKDGIDFLTQYIKENHTYKILEIGSAIGYSAIKMGLVDEKVTIITIERDHERYLEAVKNIKLFHLDDRIQIIEKDAFDVELEEQFDLIFIDAAKGQYIKFFEKFEKNLKVGGVIISDNLNFHGLIHSKEELSRNVRGLVRKLNNYIEFLKQNKQFKTEFLNIGDGISISIKEK